MIWSRLSLSGKLFFAVVLPVLFAVILMAGAVAYSMRAGFSNYLLDAEVNQFTALADVLVHHPEADDGWPSLRDERVWTDLINANVRPPAMPPMIEPGFAPGPRLDRGAPPPIPLSNRLVLVDAQGHKIAGRVLGDTHSDRPLVDDDGTLIGTLQLYQLGETPAPANSAFLAAQFRAIGLTAAIALLCASGVSWLTAQQFLAPIRRIGQHVAHLASGDLTSRLNSTRHDELGRMMKDHDILAENLAAVRQREKQWISDTSHELKTPLAVLRAQIEALQDGIRPMTPDALDSMHHAVMRLSRLTDDLSLLSRSDEGRLPLTPTDVDLCTLLQDAASDMRPRAEAEGITLCAPTCDEVMVDGDPVRLRQVIDNLLDNARRYTDPPGQITVLCKRRGDVAQITVQDTAPCPEPSAFPGLFDRFSRGETSRARSHGGSGLGLSICRALIEAHGGTISAEPSRLGGLSVRVQLPLSKD